MKEQKIGYSHNIIDNKIFIPTRHYHQENKLISFNNLDFALPFQYSNNFMENNYAAVNNYNEINNLPMHITNNNEEIADDWSHVIYFFNINPYIVKKINEMKKLNYIHYKEIMFDYTKINFNFGECENFEKIQILGRHPNIDLIIPITV